MFKKIKKLLKRQFLGKNEPSQFVLGDKSINNGIKILNRSISKDVLLEVANNSVVGGNFVFENGNGKIRIGNRTFIGGGEFICISGIEIGDDVLISWGCTFMDNNAHALDFELRKNDVLDWARGIREKKIGLYKNWDGVKCQPIKISDKAWIGFKSIILKGVTIGEGAVVGAGSVVTRDVPAWCVVAGNPAKIIKKLK